MGDRPELIVCAAIQFEVRVPLKELYSEMLY